VHASTRLNYVERAHPFGAATLADDDVTVDFGSLAAPSDRVAVVATEPMTSNEKWVSLRPGELRTFVGGRAVR
jgi:glutamine amidotransferase